MIEEALGLLIEEVWRLFINNFWDICLAIVGTSAIFTYFMAERCKQRNAAILITQQVDELQNRLRDMSTYIEDQQLKETAFYESLPLMEINYWEKYKHYFVHDMDIASYNNLNRLYEYVAEIQERQLLIKEFQKRQLQLIQKVIIYTEGWFILSDFLNVFKGISTQDILSVIKHMMPVNASEKDRETLQNLFEATARKNPNYEEKQFWDAYNQQRIWLESVINQQAFSSYIPMQMRSSLTKILKQYSMLEVTGTDGYQKLKRIARRKF